MTRYTLMAFDEARLGFYTLLVAWIILNTFGFTSGDHLPSHHSNTSQELTVQPDSNSTVVLLGPSHRDSSRPLDPMESTTANIIEGRPIGYWRQFSDRLEMNATHVVRQGSVPFVGYVAERGSDVQITCVGIATVHRPTSSDTGALQNITTYDQNTTILVLRNVTHHDSHTYQCSFDVKYHLDAEKLEVIVMNSPISLAYCFSKDLDLVNCVFNYDPDYQKYSEFAITVTKRDCTEDCPPPTCHQLLENKDVGRIECGFYANHRDNITLSVQTNMLIGSTVQDFYIPVTADIVRITQPKIVAPAGDVTNTILVSQPFYANKPDLRQMLTDSGIVCQVSLSQIDGERIKTQLTELTNLTVESIKVLSLPPHTELNVTVRCKVDGTSDVYWSDFSDSVNIITPQADPSRAPYTTPDSYSFTKDCKEPYKIGLTLYWQAMPSVAGQGNGPITQYVVTNKNETISVVPSSSLSMHMCVSQSDRYMFHLYAENSAGRGKVPAVFNISYIDMKDETKLVSCMIQAIRTGNSIDIKLHTSALQTDRENFVLFTCPGTQQCLGSVNQLLPITHYNLSTSTGQLNLGFHVDLEPGNRIGIARRDSGQGIVWLDCVRSEEGKGPVIPVWDISVRGSKITLRSRYTCQGIPINFTQTLIRYSHPGEDALCDEKIMKVYWSPLYHSSIELNTNLYNTELVVWWQPADEGLAGPSDKMIVKTQARELNPYHIMAISITSVVFCLLLASVSIFVYIQHRKVKSLAAPICVTTPNLPAVGKLTSAHDEFENEIQLKPMCQLQSEGLTSVNDSGVGSSLPSDYTSLNLSGYSKATSYSDTLDYKPVAPTNIEMMEIKPYQGSTYSLNTLSEVSSVSGLSLHKELTNELFATAINFNELPSRETGDNSDYVIQHNTEDDSDPSTPNIVAAPSLDYIQATELYSVQGKLIRSSTKGPLNRKDCSAIPTQSPAAIADSTKRFSLGSVASYNSSSLSSDTNNSNEDDEADDGNEVIPEEEMVLYQSWEIPGGSSGDSGYIDKTFVTLA